MYPVKSPYHCFMAALFPLPIATESEQRFAGPGVIPETNAYSKKESATSNDTKRPVQWLFVFAFYSPREACVFDLAECGFQALTAFGEVTRSENGIGDFEEFFFVSFEIDFATGGAADVRFREQ